MSEISGTARRYDGQPADYVILFDWASGECLGHAKPDETGKWVFRYYTPLYCGVTYVADGCSPITHGAYRFAVTDVLPVLGLVIHYPFNGDILDNSDSSLNGVKTGAATFAAGRKTGTQCIDFTAGCVQTPSALPINSKQMTVSFWAKIRSSAVTVLSELSGNYNSASGVNSTTFLAVAENGVSFPVKDIVVNEWQTPLALNTWQHFVLTIDGSNLEGGSVTLYVDNNIASQRSSGVITQKIASDILYIGARAASSLFFDGQIQDYRVYNRVLSASERTDLFNE